jgi:Ulp1 family protease
MQVPLQSNDFDCGIFICLYAAFLDILLSHSFSQHEIKRVFITNVKGTFLGMSESEEASKRR